MTDAQADVLTAEERGAVDAIVGTTWPWSAVRPIIDRLVALIQAPSSAEVEAIRERYSHEAGVMCIPGWESTPRIHTLLRALAVAERERDEAREQFADLKAAIHDPMDGDIDAAVDFALAAAKARRAEQAELSALRAMKARLEDDARAEDIAYKVVSGELNVPYDESEPAEREAIDAYRRAVLEGGK